MRTLTALIAATALLVAAAAIAQKTETKAQDTKQAQKGEAAKPSEGPPKPDAALQQYKGLVGTWKCDGKVTVLGKERPSKATMKVSWDLDGFWVNSRFEEQ